MKGFSMAPIEYRPLPISPDDVLRLKAGVGDRDRNLRLMLLRTDVGEMHIAVMTKGVEEPLYTVRHAEAETGKPCWLVHHPSDGPMYEFVAVIDVANFVALGDGRLCKRSYGTGWSEPGRIVGGALAGAPGRASIAAPSNTTTTQGSKEDERSSSLLRNKDVVSRGGAGSRGRYLPMLGDRAGE
jgi:hypothetical protein